MRRHLRLYAAFWRNCIRQVVEYRANFFSNVATNFGWLFTLILFLKLIYRNTQAVAGWTEPEMFILVGTYSVLRGITDTIFYNNLSQLPEQMRLGTMDFVLLRPVNSQFFMSLRYVGLDNLGQLVGAVGVLVYGLTQNHVHVTPSGLGAYVFLMICAVMIFYSVSLLVMTLSFWLIKLENLFILLDTFYSMARTPIDVFRAFGRGPQFLLTYIIPIAFFAAMPVKGLFGRLTDPSIMAAAVGLSVVFFILSTLFWQYACRSYASASS